MDPNEQPPQEPSLPPAEQMRQKRLAKLNSMNNAAPPTPAQEDAATRPQSSASTPSTETPKAAPKGQETGVPAEQSSQKINIRSARPAGESSTENPFAKLGVKNAADSSRSADSGQSAPAAKKIHTSAPEALEDWANRALSDIFRVTLDPHRNADSHGHKLSFLSELHQELQTSGEPLKISSANIDSAILEAARLVPTSKALLDYLLPCWKRVIRATKAARRPTEDKMVILEEAKRLCMSNCIFALSMPEYFGRDPNPNHDSLASYLLRQMDNDDGICIDFFTEAVSRIQDDESVAQVFTEAMVQLSGQLSKLTMNDDYKRYVNILLTYARYPPLLDALAQHPRFQMVTVPEMTKEAIATGSETQTILGPFFRISALQAEVAKNYFPSPRTLDEGHVRSAQNALQMTTRAHQSDLASVVNAFVRSGQTPRNKILDWFAFIMNSNHKRSAMQVKANEVASDGFMLNVTAVLNSLSQPFMDSTFSKISKIDIDYLRREPRIDIRDETKINADQSKSDAFYGKKVDGSSNFISEVFFTTLAAHHYGTEASNSNLKNLEREIKYMEKGIKQIEDEIVKLQNDPRLSVARHLLERHTKALETAKSQQHALTGMLMDQTTQQVTVQFMRYVSVWLLRVASGTDYIPGKSLDLPLPEAQPDAFCCLPEYSMQVVVEYFKWVFRHIPNLLVSAVGDEIITLCITFLRSSEYVKNPYHKSALVTLLFSGTFRIFHLTKGVLGDALISSKFANDHLLHGLMKFYIECESSGVSTAFYDKFNIRYEIFQIIKAVWEDNPVYKENLSKESKVNRSFFVQFVNLLLNDATYLLDEALSKLHKIHDYQKQLEDQGLSREDREKVSADLEQAEQQAQNYMQLVNETMKMMTLFTKALRDAFTMPEIVVRLASMLNYNLETLVGPKRTNLKVQNASKYNFEPRTLLAAFVDIYLNLGSKESFIEAVAADGRSYKPANFQEAYRILQGKNLKSEEELNAWIALTKRVAEAKERADQAELDLGEIPSEFEDPILGDLMKDPVILPSQAIVDRSTIIQHLLSDAKDPFTRQPMTMDDVVPADELRGKIEAWMAERIAEAKAKATNENMDTTEG